MNVPEVIAAHTNTDFDAFAAMLAAAKLYPRARICLTGALNRNDAIERLMTRSW